MTHGAPLPGGHAFSPSFNSASSAAQSVSTRGGNTRRRILLAVGGAVVLVLACVGVQLAANLGYDSALASFTAVAQDAEEQQILLADKLASLEETTAIASKVTDAASETLIDAPLKETLTTAVADAETVTSDSASLSQQELRQPDEKPAWAWELLGETTQLNADHDNAQQLIEDFESAHSDASDAAAAVEAAGVTVVVTAAEASQPFESAHVSARNLDIIALREAAEQLNEIATIDDAAASAYVDLETAAAQMLTSEKAEIAEKAGPLRDARVEIEEFARSIAPGVLLDFDWSERVNGYGYGDSMGGYASWWYADPGYATIELSNSVAVHWPSDRSKSLVAHEVGHTMSVKCGDMYDDSTQENIEAWATAWAISMGYHNIANGTSAYGAPPQSLIETAAGCR
ncbi:MAG: hypothetical protein ACTH8F_11320 [Microbacterium sp.]|uniref:hypothetical protein n=1 Tax=Microbacterium sp. TaxID=51671 RepID=UPI003F9E0906